MSKAELQAELIKKLSAVVSTTHNIVENRGKNKEPRCPWTMPGSYMVVGETAQEWLKPPKSPDREVVGSVEYRNLRILKTYSPKGVFLSYYDKSSVDHAGKPTLIDVQPFREKARGSATWNATQTSRSITGAKGIKKLNGMDAAKSAEEAIFKIPATIPPVTFADIVKSFLAVNLRLDPTILISGASMNIFLLACI